jgi:hypothetical protein
MACTVLLFTDPAPPSGGDLHPAELVQQQVHLPRLLLHLPALPHPLLHLPRDDVPASVKALHPTDRHGGPRL